MIAKFFAPLAMKVGGGIVLALLIALAVTMWRAAAISAQRDKAIAGWQAAEARHEITAASLTTLQRELAEMVNAGAARRAAATAALVEARAAGTALLDQAADIREAIIADPGVTPDEVMRGDL